MAHILGLEHSLAGIAGQVFGGVGSLPGWRGISGFGGMLPMNGYTGPPEGWTDPLATPLAAVGDDDCVSRSLTEVREVVINRATGAVICIRKKKSRKRRKRIATNSDIADLAALREVLGPKAMMSYMAVMNRNN